MDYFALGQHLLLLLLSLPFPGYIAIPFSHIYFSLISIILSVTAGSFIGYRKNVAQSFDQQNFISNNNVGVKNILDSHY